MQVLVCDSMRGVFEAAALIRRASEPSRVILIGQGLEAAAHEVGLRHVETCLDLAAARLAESEELVLLLESTRSSCLFGGGRRERVVSWEAAPDLRASAVLCRYADELRTHLAHGVAEARLEVVGAPSLQTASALAEARPSLPAVAAREHMIFAFLDRPGFPHRRAAMEALASLQPGLPVVVGGASDFRDLQQLHNVHVAPSLGPAGLIACLLRADVVITDSHLVEEIATHFRTRVVLARTDSATPELVRQGASRCAGSDAEAIVEFTDDCVRNPLTSSFQHPGWPLVAQRLRAA
jgi:UDP-N-acetylglucosamine 2-epimerase